MIVLFNKKKKRPKSGAFLFCLDEHPYHVALIEHATVKIGGDVARRAVIAEDEAGGKVAHRDVAVIRKFVDGKDLPRKIFDVFHSAHGFPPLFRRGDLPFLHLLEEGKQPAGITLPHLKVRFAERHRFMRAVIVAARRHE